MGNPQKKRTGTRTIQPHQNYNSKNKCPQAIRAADAKEVGVGNPAEETCRHPNQIRSKFNGPAWFVNKNPMRLFDCFWPGNLTVSRDQDTPNFIPARSSGWLPQESNF